MVSPRPHTTKVNQKNVVSLTTVNKAMTQEINAQEVETTLDPNEAPKSPEIPTPSSINSSHKKVGPKNISDRFSSSKPNYDLKLKCKLCQKKVSNP